jgi:hypothetical protein
LKYYQKTGGWTNLGKAPATALTLITLGLLFIFMEITGIGIHRRAATKTSYETKCSGLVEFFLCNAQ